MFLESGSIVEEGTSETLFSKPQKDGTKRFLAALAPGGQAAI